MTLRYESCWVVYLPTSATTTSSLAVSATWASCFHSRLKKLPSACRNNDIA
jgi:hypothetical protein